MKDEIVEEVRRAREAYAAQFDFDIRRMAEDLRRRQAESGRDYVSLPPRTPEEITVNARPAPAA